MYLMVTLKNKEFYFIALNNYQHRFLLSVAFTFLCNILSICFKQTKISLLLLSTNSFYIGPQIRVPFGFSESEISDLINTKVLTEGLASERSITILTVIIRP